MELVENFGDQCAALLWNPESMHAPAMFLNSSSPMSEQYTSQEPVFATKKTDLVNRVFLSIKVGNSGGPLVNLVWLLVFNNICYQFYTFFLSSSKLLAEWIRCVIDNKTHWIKKGKIFSIVLWGCWKKVEAKSWIELINLTQDTGKHLLVNINVSFQLGRLCVIEKNYW